MTTRWRPAVPRDANEAAIYPFSLEKKATELGRLFLKRPVDLTYFGLEATTFMSFFTGSPPEWAVAIFSTLSLASWLGTVPVS